MKRNIKSVILTVLMVFTIVFTGCDLLTNGTEKEKKNKTNTSANNPVNDDATVEPDITKAPDEIPLTLQAITSGTIILSGKDSFERISIQKGNGLIFDCADNIDVQPGDIIHFYGINYKYVSDDPAYTYYSGNAGEVNLTIDCTADCYVYGNAMSLLYYTNFTGKTEIKVNYALQKLFLNNTHIKNHETLDIILPATTLSEGCYKKMFYGCTGLTRAPELPAATLTNDCYNSMFFGCTNLNYIKCLAANILAKDCTCNWIYNVCNTGSFISNQQNNIWLYKDKNSGIPGGWISDPPFEKENARELPLTLEAIEDGRIMIDNFDSFDTLQYSINGVPQPEIDSQFSFFYINVQSGDKVCFFAKGCGISGVPKIKCNSDFYIYGNIMSLINPLNFSDETTIPNNYCFKALFAGTSSEHDTHLKNCAIDLVLPAETLTVGCYNRMFEYCEGLTVAAELPAKKLAPECYNSMYAECTGLMFPPKLDADEIAAWCYKEMFRNCTNLTVASELPATTLSDECYNSMFYGCASLQKAPELPAETLAQYCYSAMFYGCTNLTQAPELPATVLKDHCYSSMFSLCTGLTKAPELPAETLAQYCYFAMFFSCTQLKSAPRLDATTLKEGCYQQMFMRCSNLTEAPELPAQTLETFCYDSMFNECNNLHIIKCFATKYNDGALEWNLGSGLKSDSAGLLICNDLTLFNDFPSGWVKSKGVPLTLEVIKYSGSITVEYTDTTYYSSSFENLKYLKNFESMEPVTTAATISVKEGDIICFVADKKITDPASRVVANLHINCSTDCYIYGDVWSLSQQGVPAQGVFNKLFKDNTHIKNHPSKKLVLSATTLTIGCYLYMFQGCTGLTVAPELPATEVQDSCYIGMFKGCTGITVSPELNAETLVENCYQEMFYGCTSLKYVKCLANKTSDGARWCLLRWMYGVSDEGVFVTSAPDFYEPDSYNGIPDGWTVVNY